MGFQGVCIHALGDNLPFITFLQLRYPPELPLHQPLVAFVTGRRESGNRDFDGRWTDHFPSVNIRPKSSPVINFGKITSPKLWYVPSGSTCEK